jgi:hypothetical protein
MNQQKSPLRVMPAKAGIQKSLALLDPGLRRGDKKENNPTFCCTTNIDKRVKKQFFSQRRKVRQELIP